MAMRMRHTEVGLPADGRWLDGVLAHHPHVPGLVIQFERGGGMLRHSRGSYVVEAIKNAGFATLHVGLLSHDEERKAPEVWHQVATLSVRIAAVLEWIEHQPALQDLPLGIAARDAATAAMIRVASRGNHERLAALASRGGRPDLAGLEPLSSLTTPLLLVTGELDDVGPVPNQQAYDQIKCAKEIAVIKGASHAFEEPGTLEDATRRIVSWLQRWLQN